MRIQYFANVALLACGLALAGVCAAEGNNKAAVKADAWVGKDASELLLQLRVDGGRVVIEEIDETGETTYTWSTWNAAYTTTEVTGVDRQVVGMSGGGPAAMPIFQDTVYTRDVYHPATHRCDITFTANADGIVTKWEYTGNACRHDIKKPKDKK